MKEYLELQRFKKKNKQLKKNLLKYKKKIKKLNKTNSKNKKNLLKVEEINLILRLLMKIQYMLEI